MEVPQKAPSKITLHELFTFRSVIPVMGQAYSIIFFVSYKTPSTRWNFLLLASTVIVAIPVLAMKALPIFSKAAGMLMLVSLVQFKKGSVPMDFSVEGSVIEFNSLQLAYI